MADSRRFRNLVRPRERPLLAAACPVHRRTHHRIPCPRGQRAGRPHPPDHRDHPTALAPHCLGQGIFVLLLLATGGWILHLRKRRWERKRKAELARQHEEMLRVSRDFQQSLQASEEALAQERLARSEVELQGKNQELASTTMHLVQKSEVLQTIRQRLATLKPQLPKNFAKDVQGILDLTQQDERLDANWEQFSQHFDQVHVDFQNRLRELYPHLTKNDLKLCAYIRLNLSSKEIASLMFVTVRAVEISRFRLRKRLDLDKGINLNEFIQRL